MPKTLEQLREDFLQGVYSTQEYAMIEAWMSQAVAEEREACKRLALDRWIVGQHHVALEIAEKIERREGTPPRG